MINRLRRRFILIAMSSVVSVMVLLGVSINAINFFSIDSDLEEMLEMISHNQGVLPEFSGNKKPAGQPEHRKIPFTPETPYATRYFVLRYDKDGVLINADMRHIAAVTEDDVDVYLSFALSHGEGFGYFASYKFYILSADEGKNMAVFLDCRGEQRAVRAFALATLLAIAVSVVLIFILVVFFSRRAIDPAVRNAEKQKQFITDASHELKTPLTVITASLKVLEMETGRQKWIDKAQLQVDKMRELINALVTLSRLDEEKPALCFTSFDVSEAVAETAGSFRDFAAAQGFFLALDIPSGLICRGDEYAIRQLVSILVDNAVKYSDAGGEIHLSLEKEKQGVKLKISNTCTGIGQAELDRIFDRFYRIEKSRSRKTGGFGVGLSIARSIAEAHHGSIKAECPDENTIRFTAFLNSR